MTVESNRQEIASIQMLRGIAASMVVLVHLDVQLRRQGLGALGTGWGATGVDIFFVISGFIMWVTTANRAGMTGAEFMKNRIVRIVPLYWLVTSFVLAMALLSPKSLHTTVFEPAHTLASFLFLPARHPVTGDFWPLVIPGWTLNCEMLFYVLFAFSIPPSRGLLWRRALLIAGSIIFVMVTATILRSRIDVMNFYANPILLEFVAGTLLGILYLSGRVPPSRLWFVAIFGGFLLLWRGNAVVPAGVSYVGAAATMIVAGALFIRPFKLPFLQHVGDASYSLYLSHTITLAAFASIWGALAFPRNALLFACIGFGVSLLVASCVFRLIERPMTAALKGMSRRRHGRVAAGHGSRTVVPYLNEDDRPEIVRLGDPAR